MKSPDAATRQGRVARCLYELCGAVSCPGISTITGPQLQRCVETVICGRNLCDASAPAREPSCSIRAMIEVMGAELRCHSRWLKLEVRMIFERVSLLVWHMEYRPGSHPDHTTDQGISRLASSQPVLAVHRRCFSLVYRRNAHFECPGCSNFCVGDLLGSPIALCGCSSPHRIRLHGSDDLWTTQIRHDCLFGFMRVAGMSLYKGLKWPRPGDGRPTHCRPASFRGRNRFCVVRPRRPSGYRPNHTAARSFSTQPRCQWWVGPPGLPNHPGKQIRHMNPRR